MISLEVLYYFLFLVEAQNCVRSLLKCYLKICLKKFGFHRKIYKILFIKQFYSCLNRQLYVNYFFILLSVFSFFDFHKRLGLSLNSSIVISDVVEITWFETETVAGKFRDLRFETETRNYRDRDRDQNFFF